jgi:serine/threonine-protein kinase
MAPEQLSGESVDGRSDLFSLGVILYTMVTGHSAFQGSSATTVCFKVANREPVAASALDMTLPPQLDAVISRAIAKNPDERYQRGAEFAEDLRILQQNYQPGATTTSLAAITGMGVRPLATRTATASALRPVAAVADAQHVVRYALFNAPIRDLVLGAVVLILLVILGAQSKLFVISPKLGLTTLGAAPASPDTPPTSVPESAKFANPSLQGRTQPILLMPSAHHFRTRSTNKNVRTPAEVVVPSSTLDIAVQHQFKDATLFVWVDDKLMLSRPLHGGVQKRMVVFNGIRGVESETIKIPAGNHVLRFRALSTDQTADLSKTVSAQFIGGDTKSLQITFDKHNTLMRLNWQ